MLAEPAVAAGHGVPHMALACPVGFRELEKSARAGGLACLERPTGFSQSTCNGMEREDVLNKRHKAKKRREYEAKLS